MIGERLPAKAMKTGALIGRHALRKMRKAEARYYGL